MEASDQYHSYNLKESDLGQAIIESLPYFVYIIDNQGIVTHINSSMKLALKEDEMPESIDSIFEMIKFYDMKIEEPQAEVGIGSRLSLVLEGKEFVQNLVVRCRRSMGQRYLTVSAFPVKNGAEIIGCMIICNDITEEHEKNLKLMEEREQFISISTELKTKCDIIEVLRNREKEHLMHLKDVINNISEGLIVLDNKGKFNFCNKNVYSIIEISPADIVYYPNILNKYNMKFMDNYDSEANYISEATFKGGVLVKNLVVSMEDKITGRVKYIEFNSNPIKNKKEELLYTIITIKDVTDIKLHELYTEQQAAFIRDVVNTVDIPIAVIDFPEMTIRHVNKDFVEFVRRVSGEELKTDILVDINIESVFNKTLGTAMYQSLIFSGESGKEYSCSPCEVIDSQGIKRFYKFKFKPCADKNGLTNTIHIHAIDITEETNHSLELEKVTNLKDEFFTVISHELRTPLTIIYSSLQLVNDIYSREITPNINRALGRISQNCSRLLKLINNILDISKAEAGFLELNSANFDIVNITEFVVTSVNFYAKSKEIDLIFDTNEEEADVTLDKDKYEKILLNLLSNAVKFTPAGKKILVTLDVKKECFYLSVKDEGMGIPENKQESIFDRFAQVNSSLSRRAEGTGIGLSLVKKLVELMGGEISVHSKLEEGTEFLIKFKRFCIEKGKAENYSIMNTNMDERINIEFSDVN